MSTTTQISEVKSELEQAARTAASAEELMSKIVTILHERMLRYNWVGFYLLDKSGQSPVLVLGSFEGAMTPHTRIPLNQGICGAAASSGKTIIVDDVGDDPRYLACSLETKSEIVVPIFANGAVAGELDIDSHFHSAFKQEDRELLEFCANLVGEHLEKNSA
jgi:GAF domain-containing protein